MELFQLLIDAGFAPDSMNELQPLLHYTYGDAWINNRDRFLEESSIGLTNVINRRPSEHNNKFLELCCAKADLPSGYNLPAIEKGQYLCPEYLGELDRLFEELDFAKPNLIILAGNKACWAVIQSLNISSIRGTISQASIRGRDVKVLPTWHPSSLLYDGQWPRRPIVVADLMKARRESEFPDVRRPSRLILHSPTIEEWRAAVHRTIEARPSELGVDTETSLGMIDTIGFAPSAGSGFVCQFRPHRVRRGAGFQTIYPVRNGVPVANYWSLDEEREFWYLNKLLLETDIPKVFQNGLYDLQYILKMGIAPAALDEDTMLLSHSHFPEMQKGLGFLGSIHTSEPAWKLMARKADSEKRDE